jgi:hypothetical protein
MGSGNRRLAVSGTDGPEKIFQDSCGRSFAMSRELKRLFPLCRAAAMLAAGLAAPGLAAQEIYRSVDENGVVSFSDVESEDAVRLNLPDTVIREDALAELEARIALQLEVAKALEASRLAREAARTERLAALADSEDRTIYYREEDRDQFLDGWGYWGGGYWGGGGYRPGHRPGHRPPVPVNPVEPPEVQPPSRPVPLPPLPPR